MPNDLKRNQLTQALNHQLRFASANSVMFSQVIAEKVGIHSTDNECLDFLLLNGPSTAGQLSELTSLTTGAITAVIDRLEKADYVRRERDKSDRRKVIVVPNEEKIYQNIMPHVMPMGAALDGVCTDFSEAELEVVLKFMMKANTSAMEVIAAARKD